MGKKPDLSPRKRGQIKVLLENSDLNQSEIAAKLGINQSVVSRVKKSLQFGPVGSPKRKGRCGRKRITTAREDRSLLKLSRSNRKFTSKRLQIEMAAQGVQMSKRTVRRRLLDAGLKAYRPRKKPKLTLEMRKKRLKWAKQFRNWTSEDWERVCFSDESTVELLEDRCQYVRRRQGEEFLPECIVEKVKHPGKVMVWSLVSIKGPGRLHIVEGMMNAIKYQEVLDKRLVPQLEQWFPDGNCIFMQDGAPCHRANVIMNFFNGIGLEVLPWPGNSPDMNPIEGIWNDMKNKVNAILCTNKQMLIERLLHVWFHDEEMPRLIEKYIRGMPKRIEALIKAKGGHTKY